MLGNDYHMCSQNATPSKVPSKANDFSISSPVTLVSYNMQLLIQDLQSCLSLCYVNPHNNI